MYTDFQKKALKRAYLTDPLMTKVSAISIGIFYDGIHMAAHCGHFAHASGGALTDVHYWLRFAGPARHFKLLKLRTLP